MGWYDVSWCKVVFNVECFPITLYPLFHVNECNFGYERESFLFPHLAKQSLWAGRIWRPLSCGLGSCTYLSFGLHRQHASSLNRLREYVWKGTVFPNAMFTYHYSLFAATCDCLKSHLVCASCSSLYTFAIYFILMLLFLFCVGGVYCIVLKLYFCISLCLVLVTQFALYFIMSTEHMYCLVCCAIMLKTSMSPTCSVSL